MQFCTSHPTLLWPFSVTRKTLFCSSVSLQDGIIKLGFALTWQENINKYTIYTELPRHICWSTKVTTSCIGCNFVPKFDCIDCDLLKTTKHSSPDLVKRLRLFFLPALLLARNKLVMSQRTSKYKRFNEHNIDLTRFLKNVAVLGKTTTLRNSRIFGECVYKDKFSVSFSQLLFNKSQLESQRVGKLRSQFIIKTKLIIQKSIHILKRRFLLSRQGRMAGTELHLAGRGCVVC